MFAMHSIFKAVDGRNFASKIIENESQYNRQLAPRHGVGQPAADTPVPPNSMLFPKTVTALAKFWSEKGGSKNERFEFLDQH